MSKKPNEKNAVDMTHAQAAAASKKPKTSQQKTKTGPKFHEKLFALFGLSTADMQKTQREDLLKTMEFVRGTALFNKASESLIKLEKSDGIPSPKLTNWEKGAANTVSSSKIPITIVDGTEQRPSIFSEELEHILAREILKEPLHKMITLKKLVYVLMDYAYIKDKDTAEKIAIELSSDVRCANDAVNNVDYLFQQKDRIANLFTASDEVTANSDDDYATQAKDRIVENRKEEGW